MKMLISKEWMRRKILEDNGGDIEAGMPLDLNEPFATLMEREQREVAEIKRRGWSPCSMTSAQWDELRAWSMKEAE